MLRGNASIVNALQEQDSMDIDEDYGHAQNYGSAVAQPSPAQVEAAKREFTQMRTKAFATIMQRLRHDQPKRSKVPSRIVLPHPGSQRWSGQSPADAIAIRRLEQELDTVLPLRGGSPP
jgi:hypothetical protein